MSITTLLMHFFYIGVFFVLGTIFGYKFKDKIASIGQKALKYFRVQR